MISFKHAVKKIRKITPYKLKHRLFDSLVLDGIKRWKYLNTDQRIKQDQKIIWHSSFESDKMDFSGIEKKVAVYISERYLNHEYDLLGSGWVKNDYDTSATGMHGIQYQMNILIPEFDSGGNWLAFILNEVNLNSSQKIWSMVDPNYNPIDWQKDFKSGYRWSQKRWYKDQQIGKVSGSDIKVSWELGRMQHLFQLSLFAVLLHEKRDEIIREFRNQILDFISANPPGMGVQWTCTMDVAIRTVNMLLSYDLLCQLDTKSILNDSFKQAFANSIFEHGIHISENLEWNPYLRTNHFLADIAGLVFIGFYLPESEVVSTWLQLGIREFINEIGLQFNKDGSNFEASTSYHKLSGEMLVYTVALISGNEDLIKSRLQKVKGLNDYLIESGRKNILPNWIYDRLFLAGQFTATLIKPSNEIPQIGDNDSGYFLKMSPVGEFLSSEQAKSKYKNLESYNSIQEIYWDENSLNHSPFISAVDGLFNLNSFSKYSEKYPLEKSFIHLLASERKIEPSIQKKPELKVNSFDYKSLRFQNEFSVKPESENISPLTENMVFNFFPDFGIYVFRSNRIHLVMFAGSIGQNNLGGHSHNDKLSFELTIDGKDYFKDPGSYCYTPFPEYRNKFRGTHSHNVMVSEDNEEQNSFQEGINGLFAMENETKCDVVSFSHNSIALRLCFRKTIQVREFTVDESEIIVRNFSDRQFHLNSETSGIYSNGYGKLING